MSSDVDGDHVTEKRPQAALVVALGLNHALCVTKSVALGEANAFSTGHDTVKDAEFNLYSWGKGNFNCIGHGLNTNLAKTPKAVPFFKQKNVLQVSCGDYHSAALVMPHGATSVSGGTVYTFGLGTAGRLGYDIDDHAQSSHNLPYSTTSDTESAWCTAEPQPVGLSVNLKHNVISLACGANHTLVTTVDGSLFSWGMGSFGVLGTGESHNSYTPVRVRFPYETFMTSCAAGCRHSFGVDDAGKLWAWGYGGNGRLGIGNTRTQYTPKMVGSLDEHQVKQAACGDTHSACIDSDGKVYTWGSSKGGKLGRRTSVDDAVIPTLVEALGDTKVVQVACGAGVTLALTEEGCIYQWGHMLGCMSTSADVPKIAHVPQKVTEAGSKNVYIAAGPYSCAAVNAYGDILTWGVGSCFRLGHGNVSDFQHPKFVAELRSRVFVDPILKQRSQTQDVHKSESPLELNAANVADERRIKQLSVGTAHGALLTCNGTVYTWGACKGSGFSDDTANAETYNEPRPLNYFSTKIRSIACGSNHTIAVTIEGLVFSWGQNDSGQLGLGDLRPRGFPEHVISLEYAIKAFAGFNNSCCVTTAKHDGFENDEVGMAWVFGSSSGGKLGLGDECTNAVIMTPRKITYISGVYKVVLGNTHSLLLQHDGTLYSTGSGADGRLGTGDTAGVNTFTCVKSGLKFIDMAVGASHSLAVSMEHDLYGWGKGAYVNGSDDTLVEPTLVANLPSQSGVAKVHSVAASSNHSFVITDQGHLIAWGDNSSGQLGVPVTSKDVASTGFIERPSLVTIESPVLSIATSRSFAACTTVNGDAYAWGTSSDGRLGIGETRDKVTYKPTAIATMSLVGDMLNRFDNMTTNNDLSAFALTVESLINELHFTEDKSVVDWKSLQIILQNEERLCWESSLKSFEDDLVKCLKHHVDFILELDRYHGEMNAQQSKLEAAIQGFIGNIGRPQSRPPSLFDRHFKVYTQLMPQIQQIVQIVFLQPAYLVRLCLFGNAITMVEDFVTCLYASMDKPRVHMQFVALLFTLLREELQLCFKPHAPLNASSSPFAQMLRIYAASKVISAPNARTFYSYEFNESFATFMKQHRLVLPCKAAPNSEELNNFTKFLLHLNKILTIITVPRYIKLAFKRMHNMVKFNIPSGWALPSVPLENVSIYPLIPVFVYSVLQPYFSSAVDMAASHGYNLDDEAVVSNFTTASQFFDYIANPSLRMEPHASQEVNRMTMAMYRNVSNMLLEYIKTLLSVEDTFNIDITMETFKSQFELEKISIELPGWTIAQFVNCCATKMKYLNISAHDTLCKILDGMMPKGNYTAINNVFGEEIIQKLRYHKIITPVEIEQRFLMHDKNMSICKFSGVFLPQRLAYRQTTCSEDCIKLMSLIIRYRPLGKYDPPRTIQNALTELKPIDMAPGGFDKLAVEMDTLAEHYINMGMPNHAAASRARYAYEQLMKLHDSGVTPCELAETILKKVLERQEQRNYLLRVYKRQREIEVCKINFEAAFRERCQYLARCIEHATKTYVEPAILNAACVNRVYLHSTKLVKSPPK
ncbi:regulator of chromosome condensation (RCC1), domain containing protein, putative [Babesia bigemina]|uniref:Regulator of chromosome condensation (RCC1), domain containing protein, putative n=1 Tax=Babesia bigemina TaxID=5866 RepID=A0A061DBY4_BABBI|nr:regulator of chromosome condensation (RCC1), domain containing protein, putative [Babesia bigemina]CDR98093.1 regulator of chromosome condensation (RCC1), domain containing protein, putative [Babesia bigemina]|eukprot:XP_012770279.1 regulator of chromosome condensation (RCC1), domain containing protein, putative [Babesia bigemina]